VKRGADRVHIQEVVTRDGFQIQPGFVATADKIALLDALASTGVAKIEVSSFVSPRAVPNLRDATEVFAGITRNPAVTYVALVPNLKGAEAAMRARVDEVNLVVSASDTHNRANMRMSVDESLAQFEAICSRLAETSISRHVTVATAFGCPFEGLLEEARILRIVSRCRGFGVRSFTLADTTGMADPVLVSARIGAVLAAHPEIDLTLHFHNTRGMGLANVVSAWQAGARRFDAALGGIGGCPFAPGATGNICTEDTVHMFERMGVGTGVDLPALMALSRGLARTLGHDLPGQVAKAGRTLDLHQPPASTAA
jgi:hydroxymethylglutaryl-CoA lyase